MRLYDVGSSHEFRHICVTARYASPLQTQTTESVAMNIRSKARQRDLIDQAAERLGRSRLDFMLEAACREAENLLLDQTFVRLMRGPLPNFMRYSINRCRRPISCAVC